MVAAAELAKVAIWFHRLVSELGYPEIPKILIDNQACIRLVKEAQIGKRSKHIEVRNMFLKEKIEEKRLDVEHVPPNSNLSDILTKPLNKTCFQRLRKLIGIQPRNALSQ